MDEYVRDFVQESEENITALNNALLRLENDPDDEAAMEEIFRTAHTLKGNSGAMGFTDASNLAHALEDLLETVRSGGEPVTPALMDQVFDGVDLLEEMVDEVRRHGEPQTDPSAVIDELRAEADGATAGITAPTESTVEDLLSAVNTPADSAHDVYHVRLDIAEDGGDSNGVRVVEALRDAFDLLGTDPPEPDIEGGDYGGVFDAAFASPVGETAISAALEPVDAVDDAIITGATEVAASAAAADESDAAAAVDADADDEPADDEAADDMSVDELLEDDEVDQFDDLDDMVDEVDDMEGLDDLGEAGSFADIDADPEISSGADDSADDSLVDDTETTVEAADADEAESSPEADDEVEDASSTFAELQEEVDPVGFDELQDELDELEFDELDEDDEVGFDELIGEEADDDDFEPFDGDEDISDGIEDGLAGNVDVEGDLLDDDATSEAGDAFGDVAFGEEDATDDVTASGGTDDPAADGVTASDDAEASGDDSGLSADAAGTSSGEPSLGDLGLGDGEESGDGDGHADETDPDDALGDIDFGGAAESDDGTGDADAGSSSGESALSDALEETETTTAATTTDDAADASVPEDDSASDDDDSAAGDAVDTGGFGDVDIDDTGSVVDTGSVADEQFEGFDSPETDADASGAADSGVAEASTAAGDENAKGGSSAGGDERDDGSRAAIDQSGSSSGTDDVQSVRVDVEDIDNLMNLVEGMVTSRVRLRRAIERGESLAVLDDELDELEDITGELQDTVMDIRLVPLSSVTNRLPRVVRDISREQDKQVEFETTGGDVEIDRSILNDIGDPLVHLVRNAVDHGIEPPEERETAGKDPEGSIELRARRERDEVVIEIEDDGRGLDVDRIRRSAAEEGVADEQELAEMDDDEVYDLIFHSGFSTTETVTDVSGRGVGMDVVATTVSDLDGSVDVESDPGEGTTVRLRLPVTVAIADVLFVQSGEEEYGIPIKNVQEIGPVGEIETVDGEEIVRRDETEYPLLRLSEALDTPSSGRNNDGMIVRIRDEIRPVAIKCDQVRGQQEVVVKPYEGVLGGIPGLSGATVLGEGDVVNILDVESL